MIFYFVSLVSARILHYNFDDYNNGQFYKEHLSGFTTVLKLIENHDPNEGALDPALLELQDQIKKALVDHYWHWSRIQVISDRHRLNSSAVNSGSLITVYHRVETSISFRNEIDAIRLKQNPYLLTAKDQTAMDDITGTGPFSESLLEGGIISLRSAEER